MNRVKQNVPFAANCSGRDEQSNFSPGANPFISESAQRFISPVIPACWKCFDVQSPDVKLVRNLALNRYQVMRLEIGFKIYKCLNRPEGEGTLGIHYAHPAAVPSAAKQARTLACCSLGGIATPTDAPETHQL